MQLPADSRQEVEVELDEPKFWHWRHRLSGELQLGQVHCEAGIDFGYQLLHYCYLLRDSQARKQQAGGLFEKALEWAQSNEAGDLYLRELLPNGAGSSALMKSRISVTATCWG